MKPSKIRIFLVAFLVLLLGASQAIGAISYTRLTPDYVPFAKISRNSITPTPLLGFRIDGVDTTGLGFICLQDLILKSFITKAFSVSAVKLFVETNGQKGLQTGVGGDQMIAAYDTRFMQFDVNDTMKLASSVNYCLKVAPDSNLFYIAIEAYHDSVVADPPGYSGECLEALIMPERLKLTPLSVGSNTDTIYNEPIWSAPDPCTTGFKPSELPMGNPCRYRLCFDTQGPQFALHFCPKEMVCPGDTTVHQGDTVQICATGISPDINVDLPITIIDSKKTFLVNDILLRRTDKLKRTDCDACDSNYHVVFQIPDKKNDATYTGIDADTGSWKICAFATDSAGNVDTICIQHAPDLTWKIDTRKPVIDAVTCSLWYDANGDGIAALGDSLLIIGWGLSNPWQPVFEVDSMVADVRRFGKGWIKLDDVLNNNRVFRKKICLDQACFNDTADCNLNVITVWAWDNACNYDTLRKGYCGPMDLERPGLGPLVYEYNKDYDTTFACIGIGDRVHIQATVSGNDIKSVTADLKDAGIDAQDRAAYPLPHLGGNIYDLIWTVTEPPIEDGKDANNCISPLHDSVYTVTVRVCDDADNCTTLTSPYLNRTLDTRVPRPIGFNCPDSVPCALHARSLKGGIIQLYWNRACDECDAFYYYVYASSDGGVTWDSIGSTYDNESGDPNYNFWHSEVLPAGYYQFKVKTEDDCGNLGPYSCAVGALADSTPPNACIVYPNTGETFGFPFEMKARTLDQDINNVGLWYRYWPNYPSDNGRSEWKFYTASMTRFDLGYVFFKYHFGVHGYQGWVEVLPYACDVIGNCQDTTRAYDEACLDDSFGNIPVPGHFFFYWDTTNAVIQVMSVNDTISPQTSCGFNVKAGEMNQVILNVAGSTAADSFTLDVRGIVDDVTHRVDYRNHVTMPCTVSVSVQNWPAGTQTLFVYAVKESNGRDCIPYPLKIDLCVPPQAAPCMEITSPVEWQRIPCSKTDNTNICITAGLTENCPDTMVSQVEFRWSPTGAPPWYYIGEDLTCYWVPIKGGVHMQKTWSFCWNNKEFIDSGQLHDGDPVYFIAIGYDQYHVADTSHAVKVYLDCQAPQMKLILEDVVTSCDGIPKISGNVILKAEILSDTVDVTDVTFWYKPHTDPDIPAYWKVLSEAEPAWYKNIWAGEFDTDSLLDNTWYDIRVSAKDQAGNVWMDYDEDGMFDDSTFSAAVAESAGITVYVDNEAPQPAISMVADTAGKIFNVNPSTFLGGSGDAYVQAGHDINAQVSILPSEDTCEVMKVEWYLCLPTTPIYTAPKGTPPKSSGTLPSSAGDNCDNPIEVTLPQDLTYLDEHQHTCGRGDDYHNTCLRSYDSSEDIIYRLNVTMSVAIDVQWWTSERRFTGVALFEDCPDHPRDSSPQGVSELYPSSQCLYHETAERAQRWHHLNDHFDHKIYLRPGTYYLMLDSKYECIGEQAQGVSGQGSSKTDGDWFDLKITGEPTNCYFVGLSTDPTHFPVDFNPVKDGIIPAYELEDGWWYGHLRALTYDSLGNSNSDYVGLYILDITPTQAVIVEPLNDSYVSGDVTLQSKALNEYEICKVCYEYKPEGDSVWHPVNQGYPNACTTREHHDFELVWHTLNTVPDGAYYLRAVATDCSNNVDTLPRTIKVVVNNQPPTAVIEDPRICSRTCPDDTVDTLGYVSGTVSLYATASSPDNIPITKVEFYYKNIFTYPAYWTLIGTDDFPTNDKYSVEWSTPSDGRYNLKAVAYNAAGRYGDSKLIEISVDNSGPYAKIISIMGEDHLDNGVDITKGAVIPIELVSIDSTSNDGWTRCYNSGLTRISVCIAMCDSNYNPKDTTEITKCFAVDSVYDGIHTMQWNTSGLEFEGCSGCYYIYVKAYDCLGNETVSDSVKVFVRDITSPVTIIGGFDENTILGYSTEKVKSLLFEYADSGSTNWIPIGWSSYIDACCSYYLYRTSWNPASLTDGVYQVRVISHDSCSNQADSLAPWTFIHVENGTITPYNPDVLGPLSFEKNWCVGGMHGIVRQTCSVDTPVVLAYYGGDYGECVEMQAHLQNTTEYAGSFNADYIDHGGPAKFFSSVTVKYKIPPATGLPISVTYLSEGSFDVAEVKSDLGTHGTYQNGCVDVTIQGGAVSKNKYIWVAPTVLEWAPVSQPTIKPIGDNNGYATYVSFTDCYYCCGWYGTHFGWDKGGGPLKSPADGSDNCCFNPGRYAKIKMCYDSTVTTDKAHLAVMWWDCEDGEFKSDPIFYPNGVEGFNTENHTVEFATTCLNGPFVVVELIEPHCSGSIVVNMLDVEPYCNQYTNAMPQFKAMITDNVEGTDGIDKHSIQFKVDLFNPGELVRIFDGSHWEDCHKWATGFGSFPGSGYDKVSGIFKAGWNDPTYEHYSNDDNDKWSTCDHCFESDNYTYCLPMYPLAEGNHIAVVTAANTNIQTCTDTVQIMVDATKPRMAFADSIGAYVSKNPHFCMYFNDAKSGIDKHSIWMDVFGANSYNYTTDPSSHYYNATIAPDQLHWVNDTTVCVDLTYEFSQGGYLHVFVYGGPVWKCGASCPNYNYYGYNGGIADCVGNRLDPFWRYFVIDAYGPTITNAYNTLCDPVLKFQITDAMSGVGNVYVYEDSTLKSSIVQDMQNPSYWYYTPSAGPHHVDIRAYDKLGNLTVKSFDLAGDCSGPVVSFVPSFVSCKTPTVKIVITDPNGVKWDSLKVDLYTSDYVLQTFEPNTWTKNGDTITVVGNGAQLNLNDGSVLYAVVYTEKTGTTSYSRGPEDSVGNATASQWYKKAYYADCYGPTITWKYDSSLPTPKECQRPVKLQVTDAKSGVATVNVFEDGVEYPTRLEYDTSSGLWFYTPATGKHTLDVVATDLMGNSTTYTFDVKSDCLGPAVACGDGNYVTKDPHVKFTVTDPSGVDWNTVNARVYGCGKECLYLAPELYNHVNLSTGVVTLDCILDCSDGSVVDVYVYSGTSYTGLGPADLLGNYSNYYRCSYVVDAGKPTISVLNTSSRPIEICFSDAKSGIDWSSLEFYEDSVLICQGLACVDTNVHLDTAKACVEYEPGAGRKYVEIRVKDNAGNWTTYYFYTEEEFLILTDPHNYPNPFDPRDGATTIDLGLSKSAYVTVKIYDFSGEFVTTLCTDAWKNVDATLTWKGTTDDGTQVATGTYLCYVHARDASDATKTAVIKITVLKRD